MQCQSEVLAPEPFYGSVEYKLTLLEATDRKLQHYASQMRWRISESESRAVYYIGVNDNGTRIGMPRDQVLPTINTLERIVNMIDGDICKIELQSYNDLWIVKAVIKSDCPTSFMFDF